MYRRIKRSELNELAQEWSFSFEAEELDEFHKLTEYIAATTDELDILVEPPVGNAQAVRDAGRPPDADEDPYNAIVRWCSVKSEGVEGVLSGTRIGLKDSVAVAGVPLSGGSSLLRNFVPTTDSVVARRVLEAGAEIVAMTNMDYLGFSGGGDTSAYGPTLCPFDPARTAGGSSGGSAAALYYDDVDVSIGCDQGGSIRVPASWCGVIGLKPTHGLVPYVGILGIDQSIDHVGPMARTATEGARLLQATAGKDPADPRQPPEVPHQDYISAVEDAQDLRGLRVGILAEGFGDAVGVAEKTRDAVLASVDRLAELGADVREVSVPEHLRGAGIAFAGFVEGMTALIAGGGNGYHWRGRYWPELATALSSGVQAYGNELSPQLKLALVYGVHLRRRYFGAMYAKAQNLHGWLRAGYDRALNDVDMLVAPTTPDVPHPNDPSLPIAERVVRGWGVLANTAQTNITGHPVITIPAAEVDGLPVGVMLIGRHFEDARLLALASAFERRFGWLPRRG